MSIYSKKYKFCFIHVEKCAGISIRDALSENLKIRHFKSLFYLGPMRGKGGQKATDYIKLLGREEYDKYFSFAFVRNPFDRLVSWYLYDNLKQKNFNLWIEYFFNNIDISQMDHLVDQNDKIAVNFIGRFENLQNDFDKITEKIGINKLVLPHKNKFNGERNYRDFYTKDLRILIENKLKKELDFFNYEF